MEFHETIVLDIAPPDEGGRLDRYLAAHVPGLSRARAQAIIRDGRVRVGETLATDPNRRLKAGERVAAVLPPPAPASAEPQAMPLDIRYEDAHLLVIEKPAGLVVHPAPGHASGTLVNALLAHCGDSLSGIGGTRRPGIVHRIDKDTSGLLAVAKTEAAHRGLARQFAAHGADGRLKRVYLALCWGAPARPRGVIEAPIGRRPTDRRKMAIVPEGTGRRAATHYAVLETFADTNGKPLAALLRLELETGRTHQIRVHMAHIGHPLLGDPVYGAGFKTRAGLLAPGAREALELLGRQALHAAELGFDHPETGAPLHWTSAPPPDLARLIAALRLSAGAAAAAAAERRGRKR